MGLITGISLPWRCVFDAKNVPRQFAIGALVRCYPAVIPLFRAVPPLFPATSFPEKLEHLQLVSLMVPVKVAEQRTEGAAAGCEAGRSPYTPPPSADPPGALLR